MGDELMEEQNEKPMTRREKNLAEAERLKNEASWKALKNQFRERRQQGADQKVTAEDEQRRWDARRERFAARRAERKARLGPDRLWDRRCGVVAVGVLVLAGLGAGLMSQQVESLHAEAASAVAEQHDAEDQAKAEESKIKKLPSKPVVASLLSDVEDRGDKIADIQTKYLSTKVGEDDSRALQNAMQEQFGDGSWKNTSFDARTAWFGSDLGDEAKGLTWHYATAQYLDADHIQAFWTLTNEDNQLYAWAVSAYNSETEHFEGLTVGKTTYGDRLLAKVHPNISEDDSGRQLPDSVKKGNA